MKSAISYSSSRDKYAIYCTDARRIIEYVNSEMGEQILYYDGTPVKGMFGGDIGADSGCRRQDYKVYRRVVVELEDINSGVFNAPQKEKCVTRFGYTYCDE